MSVLIETTVGDIVVDLYCKQRSRTVLNSSVSSNRRNNLQNFIAQTGDPTGSGRGGESIFSKLYGDQARYFEQETAPQMKHVKRGTLSMVNNGEDGHGSQFFLTLAENLDYLDGVHTVFGEVAEGFETLDKLNDAICDEAHRPYQDIRITHTFVLDDPFPDDKNMKIPSRSPSPSLELLKNARIGVEEDLDETKGKSLEQIQEEIEKKEARARAHILEMVGDLHHADEKPPDNVLFVCKLNALTTEDDLEIIFSRFGKIKCCEIIKDKKTGNSLQYAFIEFEEVESCENAYFKMDNVLIDDRRIHVDFSQSVAKNYQWHRQVPSSSERKPQKAVTPEKIKRDYERAKNKKRKSRSRSRSPPRQYKQHDRHHDNRKRKEENKKREREREHQRRKKSRSRSDSPRRKQKMN